MWEIVKFILLLTGYILLTYYIVKYVAKLTINFKSYLRILLLSFFYALFWGIGFAGSGGDPGFAFPVPNIVAIILMASIGFYDGILIGLIVFGFWWTIIFIVMVVDRQINKRQNNYDDE